MTTDLILDACRVLEKCRINTSQAATLLMAHRDKAVASGEIKRFLGASSAGISCMLNRLERRGLIARSRGDEDRRIVWITLTEDGDRFVDGIFNPVTTTDQPEPQDGPATHEAFSV